MFVATASRKSNSGIPAIINVGSELSEREHRLLNTRRGSRTMRHAYLRRRPILSRTNATDTSAMEMVEVRAATVRRVKTLPTRTLRIACGRIPLATLQKPVWLL